MKQTYISYLRVSTESQRDSGLGLEAQRTTVTDFLNGGSWELVSEYLEVESGRKDDRPELEAALSACRIHNAILVVAKVDRLTRSSAFLHKLLDAGVEIRFCDLPEIAGPAGKFMLNQMAAVAELEAGLISQRTKAALAAAKARGVRLGNPGNATPEGRRKGSHEASRVRIELAAQRARDLAPVIDDIRALGALSLRQIARELNSRGILASRGGRWSAAQVRRVMIQYRGTSVISASV